MTLIIYATKNGTTRDVAERIKSNISGAVLCDVVEMAKVSLDDFDRIIIGSCVYVGSINKQVKAFVKKNAKVLLQKEIGLFLCGMQPSESNKVFESHFPKEILNHAKAKSLLGGIYDPKKAGAVTRFVFKTVAKISEYTDTIDDGKIKEFTGQFSC